MTKTSWFPGSVEPTRVGVYQRLTAGGDILYSHWNGKRWGLFHPDTSGAELWSRFESAFQSRSWRGLAKEPKP